MGWRTAAAVRTARPAGCVRCDSIPLTFVSGVHCVGAAAGGGDAWAQYYAQQQAGGGAGAPGGGAPGAYGGGSYGQQQAQAGQQAAGGQQAAAPAINPITGQPDYSQQWIEYYRSLGMHEQVNSACTAYLLNATIEVLSRGRLR